MSNAKNFIPALTGYRAIAAWIIFIYHFFPFKNVNHTYPEFISNIIYEFHIGVDMFFVLSGFLITYRYYNLDKIDFKEYMVNRFARIYPMYFIITLAVFAVAFFKDGEWSQINTLEFIFSITLTKALFSEFHFAGIAQGWTLTLEEIFYLFAPFYFILIKKSKYYLIGIPILIYIVFYNLSAMVDADWNIYGFLQKPIYSYIVEFFVGIGIAILILNNKITKTKYFTFFGISFMILYVLYRKPVLDYINIKHYIITFLDLSLLSLLGIAPIIIGLIYEKTFVQKFLSFKTMVVLGKSSYVFYLIHKGFIPIFIDEYITSNKIILFTLLNVISYLMFTYMEEPFNKFIRSKYKLSKTTKS
ncbi:MAG TPA: acyltransferase [Faecalibacter sp.]